MGWKTVFENGVTALAPGGLLISVEPEMKKWAMISPDSEFDPTFQNDIPELSAEESQELAPGFTGFRDRLAS